MSTASLVGGNISSLSDKIELLTLAFPNASNTISNFVTTLRNGEGTIAAFKTGLKGIGTVIKSHPIASYTASIVGVIATYKLFTDWVKSWQENAEKQAQESKEVADAAKEETNSLNELINRYKELAKADITNSETREEIKNIQDEIAKLVGVQADNLDLVNGKLDSQITKLQEIARIEASKDTTAYRKAAIDSKNVIDNSKLTDYLADSGNNGKNITFSKGFTVDSSTLSDEDVRKINDILNSKGLDSVIKKSALFLSDNYADRIETLNTVIEYIENNIPDFSKTDTWNVLATAKTRLEENLESAQSNYKDLVDNLLFTSDSNDITVNSLDDYKNLRNNLINEISSDESISEAIKSGLIDNEWIENQVDGYLSKLNQFSDYYNEWYDKFASDTAKGAEDVKNKFRSSIENNTENFDFPNLNSNKSSSLEFFNNPNLKFSVPKLSDEAQQEINDFNEWIDSLSNSDKDIVYKISTDFTSANVENQLNNFSDGGTVDLTLRPTVDNSELKKAGWDVSSDGTATVFTSTFSNSDGSVAINFTPIVTDEKGNYKETLSPEALQEYAEGVIAGTREDDLKLQVGAKFTGGDAIDQAVNAAEKIHLLQDYFYLKGDPSNFSLDDWKSALDDYKVYAQEVGESVGGAFETLITTKGDNDSSTFRDRVDEYVDSISTLNNAFDKFRNSELGNEDIVKLIENFPQLAGRTDDLDVAINELKDDLNNTMIADFAEQFGKMETEEDIAKLKALQEQLLELSEPSIAELKGALSEISDTYSKLSGVVDEYNETGNLTLDNLDTLLSVGDKYIDTLFDENGQLQLNKDAYVALAKAKIEDIRYSMLENAISDINQMSKNDEVTATDNLAESTGNLTEETLKLVVAKKIAEGVDKSAIQSRLDTYNQYMAILDNVENGLDNNIDKTLGLSDASNELSKSLSAEQTELENTKESLEEQKAALQDTKDGYDNAIDSIQNLIDWTEKYIKQTKEDEISALEDKKNSIDKLVEKQKELLQAEKDEYEWNKEITDKQNAVASNTLSAAVANLDDSSAGKKAAKEANDTLDESRNDIKDSLYKHELEIREQALDELKEKSDEYYDKQIDSINEFLNDEVALYKAACNMIDTNSGELYGKLLTYCQTYTTTTEAEFNHMWNSAQSAMQEYNLASVGTWDLLNELQHKSYDVDAAINDISASIETYESRIDGVKQKIEELADTAKNAADAISAINMTVDDFNGYKYSYNGQTYYYPTTEDSENSKAVASLNILKQMTNKDSKAKELLRQKGWQSMVSTIQGGIKHYAKGTRNSNREFARINEEGQETLFAKTAKGDFALLQPGTQVFTKKQTDVLNDVSSNPDSYLSDFLKKKAEEQANMPLIPTNPLYEYFSLNKDDTTQFIGIEHRKMIDKTFGDTDKMFSKTINNVPNNVNKQINITPSIQVNVQGDATQSTVKALQNEADKIVKRATENVMNIALRNKNII